SIIVQSKITRRPSILEKILRDWWPKGNPAVQQVRVTELSSGRELARLESDNVEKAWLAEDARSLVTMHKEKDQYILRVWDLPLRPPLLLVIGIPLGLGLMVFLFSRSRARRRVGTAPAKGGPVTMNPEQKL